MRKKILQYINLLVIASLFVTGCDDDSTDKISFVTSYPTFAITGGSAVSVPLGTSFLDPGVIASENGTDIPVSVSGSVDSNTLGLYKVTYTATNSDGYSASTTRLVAVVAEDLGEADLAGTYYRESNSRQSTVTKLAPGFYFMTDCWGTASSGGAPLAVNTYLIQSGPDALNLIYNESGAPFGGNRGIGTVLDNGDLSLEVTLVGAAATRTNVWIKM